MHKVRIYKAEESDGSTRTVVEVDGIKMSDVRGYELAHYVGSFATFKLDMLVEVVGVQVDAVPKTFGAKVDG